MARPVCFIVPGSPNSHTVWYSMIGGGREESRVFNVMIDYDVLMGVLKEIRYLVLTE